MASLRTFIWYVRAVLAVLRLMPKYWKIGKLRKKGELEASYALVETEAKRFTQKMLKNAGVTVELHGIENFTGVPAVIMPNHQSNFDIFLLYATMDRAYGIVAKKSLQKIPVVRTWMEYIECAFVDRSDPRQMLRELNKAGEQIPKGRSLVVFPEGTRSKGEQVNPFGSGAFKVAFKYGAPVIPVSIDGTYKIQEAHGGMGVHPAHVIMTVLPAIETAGMDKQQQRALPEQVREQILEAREKSRAAYRRNDLV